MPEFELTSNQQEVLALLVDRYRETESTVTGQYLADQLDRSPSTISKYTKELRSLNLVESIRGQKGGYRPTASAYRVLESQGVDEFESLYLVSGYDRVDVVVEEIDLPMVLDSESCDAIVHFQEPTDEYETGDLILIGPTPGTNLVVGGEVVAVTSPSSVRIEVGLMEAPVTEDAPE
ncbi:MAG: HTH domain-containing protein [Halanaeroarchaeum sp.]